MEYNKRPEELTAGEYLLGYIDPSVAKSVIEPVFPAWAKGGELEPMTRAERVSFAIRNKRDEWRERLALWIAPWLEGGE